MAPLHFPTLGSYFDHLLLYYTLSVEFYSVVVLQLLTTTTTTKHKQTHARAVVWNRVTGTRGLTSCRRHRPTTSHSTSSLSRGRWFCHRRVKAALRWHPRNELRHSEWPRLWHCPVPCEGMSRSNGYHFVFGRAFDKFLKILQDTGIINLIFTSSFSSQCFSSFHCDGDDDDDDRHWDGFWFDGRFAYPIDNLKWFVLLPRKVIKV